MVHKEELDIDFKFTKFGNRVRPYLTEIVRDMSRYKFQGCSVLPIEALINGLKSTFSNLQLGTDGKFRGWFELVENQKDFRD